MWLILDAFHPELGSEVGIVDVEDRVVRNRHAIIIAIEGLAFPYVSWGKESATEQCAIVAILDVIGIPIPRPPTDQPRRGLHAGLRRCKAEQGTQDEQSETHAKPCCERIACANHRTLLCTVLWQESIVAEDGWTEGCPSSQEGVDMGQDVWPRQEVA